MSRKRPLDVEVVVEEEEAQGEAPSDTEPVDDEPAKKSQATLSVEIEEPELNAIGGAPLLPDSASGGADARPARPLKAVPQWVQSGHRIPADNTTPVERLPLPQWLLDNMKRMGLERCFPVQAEVIPKGS